MELCFTDEMSKVILEEHQYVQPGQVATLRVYLAESVKRAGVVKEDDILTKRELLEHSKPHIARLERPHIL